VFVLGIEWHPNCQGKLNKKTFDSDKIDYYKQYDKKLLKR